MSKPNHKPSPKKTAKPAVASAPKKTAKPAATSSLKKTAGSPATSSPKNTAKSAATSANSTRYLVVVGLIVVAFFASYSFALGRSATPPAAGASANVASANGAPVGSDTGAIANAVPAGAMPRPAFGGSGASGGCCGGSSTPIEGSAKLEGGVQRISVDLSSGSYNPNTIVLAAGTPAEITFGQSSGCTAQVQSADLGFFEDLTGGPKTVKLGALQPGTYSFTCGMQMVSGTIVVK